MSKYWNTINNAIGFDFSKKEYCDTNKMFLESVWIGKKFN